MNENDEKLLHCIPRKILAKCRSPEFRLLAKEERPVVVVFVDLEGCTRLCEDLSPIHMNDLIETYFSHFIDAVEKKGGIVNEIMGDGFMAIFDEGEVCRHARAAVSAALTIHRKARELNAQGTSGLDPLLVNIGIHAGIGLVGFTRFRTTLGERWTFTASGPVTNVAARLCALATGGSILVSADVAAHLGRAGLGLDPLGPQKLKNVGRPVSTFRLRDTGSDI